MDTAQWPQEIVVKPLEEIVTNTRSQRQKQQQGQGEGLDDEGMRKVGRAAQKDEALKCPRCNSTNTKFCYYNNYSLTQPRYYCKTCRRYWTEGGSLRNIPVGGGSRKNKRSSSNISSSSPATTNNINNVVTVSNNKLPDLVAPPNVKIRHDPQDLNLGFAHDFRVISDLVQVPNSMDPPNNKTHISSSALELLTGITNVNIPRGGFTSFMPASAQDHNSMSVYTNGFDFKPTLGFSLDGIGGGGGGYQEISPGGGRLLFPFEDLKQVSSTPNNVNDQQADISTGGGYWTGMLGGGSW